MPAPGPVVGTFTLLEFSAYEIQPDQQLLKIGSETGLAHFALLTSGYPAYNRGSAEALQAMRHLLLERRLPAVRAASVREDDGQAARCSTSPGARVPVGQGCSAP